MITTATHTLVITSPSFHRMEHIPVKYTCQGENINPFINWSNLPEHCESIVLIMDDSDVPNGGFTHWIMWNIDPDQAIDENSHPGVEGKNSTGTIGYTGPCPPTGEHHYHFKIFALDIELDLPAGSDRNSLEDAMHGHVMAWGEVVGLYQKIQDPQLIVNVDPGTPKRTA
jgi:Raf kinase inhibitor-like YbhB/YbcL family protein